MDSCRHCLGSINHIIYKIKALSLSVFTLVGWVVFEASIAFRGVAAKAVMAPKTAAALVGQPLEEKTLLAALSALSEDVQIGANAPGKTKTQPLKTTGSRIASGKTQVPPWRYPGFLLDLFWMFSFGGSTGFGQLQWR